MCFKSGICFFISIEHKKYLKTGNFRDKSYHRTVKKNYKKNYKKKTAKKTYKLKITKKTKIRIKDAVMGLST